MVQKNIIIDGILEFANSKLAILAKESQIFNVLVRPYVARIVNNNINKLDKALSLIADEKGLIDIDGILDDVIDNLIVSPVKEERGIKFGNGSIQMNIPFINKVISFDKSDIEEFKEKLKELKK